MIGFSFFIFSDFIRATLNSNEIFYFLLFNGEHQNPPFPYFGFYFIGSALGHYFANLDYSIINKKENKTITLNQKLILIGLISLLIGVLLGYQYSTIQTQVYTSIILVNRITLFYRDYLIS